MIENRFNFRGASPITDVVKAVREMDAIQESALCRFAHEEITKHICGKFGVPSHVLAGKAAPTIAPGGDSSR